MQRFWSKVRKTPTCWVWCGGIRSRGRREHYGAFNYKGRLQVASRVAWQLRKGPIPVGQFVLHRCDNPLCVRPAHLFLGTQADNIRDRDRKGRQARGRKQGAYTQVGKRPRGETHGNAKLTTQKVREIRKRRMAGATLAALADRFGVSIGAIWFVSTGRQWAHVTEE